MFPTLLGQSQKSIGVKCETRFANDFAVHHSQFRRLPNHNNARVNIIVICLKIYSEYITFFANHRRTPEELELDNFERYEMKFNKTNFLFCFVYFVFNKELE